jgi:hypothetical protein
MPITTIRQFPSRNSGLSQDAYSSAVENSLTDTKQAIDDINANASQYNVATSTTSSSSVAIGTGAKTFTVPSGLGFVLGMTLRIANTASNFMTGEVTSYSSATLVMNITTIGGSGTFASWSISMAAVGANTAAAVSNTPAGNISATTVQAAINELDTEKLSSAAGAVTDTNLNTITTGSTVGDSYTIPVVTFTSKGRISSVTTAPKITLGTVIATTSGTAHQYTGINANVKEFTISVMGVSTGGISIPIFQLGDSGGYETTGHNGTVSINTTGVASANHGVGIQFSSSANAAANVWNGDLTFRLADPATNTWSISGTLSLSNTPLTSNISCVKSLTSALTQVQLTTVNGTDTFDAGSISIVYE